MKAKIVYFEEAGKSNTDDTLRLSRQRGEERGIGRFVIASTHGFTARKALESFRDCQIQLVFVGEDPADFDADLKKQLQGLGHAVVFLQDADPGIPGVAENAYRRFGEGMKVAVQCAAAAVEAGLIPEGERVIAVGGTGPWRFPGGGGADTAIVMEALGGAGYREEKYKPSKKPEWRKIHEIICKPR